MKNVNFGNVGRGIWFECGGVIYAKATCFNPSNLFQGTAAILWGKDSSADSFYDYAEVNSDWWDAIEGDEDAPKWLIIKAFEDGAKIEYIDKDEDDSLWQIATAPDWDWWECNYRVKPAVLTINIDGKEIELSEESYKKLKEALK